ncbi:MAG: hypothetical protein VX335_05490 [Pseudomonadota bacterium]|nr:hypothetical protein [Pseudomonadota bacterium]
MLKRFLADFKNAFLPLVNAEGLAVEFDEKELSSLFFESIAISLVSVIRVTSPGFPLVRKYSSITELISKDKLIDQKSIKSYLDKYDHFFKTIDLDTTSVIALEYPEILVAILKLVLEKNEYAREWSQGLFKNIAQLKDSDFKQVLLNTPSLISLTQEIIYSPLQHENKKISYDLSFFYNLIERNTSIWLVNDFKKIFSEKPYILALLLVLSLHGNNISLSLLESFLPAIRNSDKTQLLRVLHAFPQLYILSVKLFLNKRSVLLGEELLQIFTPLVISCKRDKIIKLFLKPQIGNSDLLLKLFIHKQSNLARQLLGELGLEYFLRSFKLSAQTIELLATYVKLHKNNFDNIEFEEVLLRDIISKKMSNNFDYLALFKKVKLFSLLSSQDEIEFKKTILLYLDEKSPYSDFRTQYPGFLVDLYSFYILRGSLQKATIVIDTMSSNYFEDNRFCNKPSLAVLIGKYRYSPTIEQQEIPTKNSAISLDLRVV